MSEDDLGLDAPEGGGNDDDLRQRLAKAEAEAKNAANYADHLSDRLATLEALIPKMEQAMRAMQVRGFENRNFIDDIYRRLRRFLESSGGGAGNIHFVTLTHVAGGAGDRATTPSLTYRAIDADTGTDYGTLPVTGNFSRPLNATITTHATMGFVVIRADGTIILTLTNERYSPTSCVV